VQLGIVAGKQQWLDRLEAVTAGPPGERSEWLQRTAGESLAFVKNLFSLAGSVPDEARWTEYGTTLVAAFRALGGRDAAVVACIETLKDWRHFSRA